MILSLISCAAAFVLENGNMYESSKRELMDFAALARVHDCFRTNNLTAVLEMSGGVAYVWLYEGDNQQVAMNCVQAQINNSVAIMSHNSYEDVKGSDVGSELEDYIGSFPDYEPTWFEPSDEELSDPNSHNLGVMPCLLDNWWLNAARMYACFS